MSVRRLYCLGTSQRPCPAHAWWYAERRGRPRERCDVCRPVHRLILTAESHSAKPRPRCIECGRTGAFCVCVRYARREAIA